VDDARVAMVPHTPGNGATRRGVLTAIAALAGLHRRRLRGVAFWLQRFSAALGNVVPITEVYGTGFKTVLRWSQPSRAGWGSLVERRSSLAA
jgi:hypothetical protein